DFLLVLVRVVLLVDQLRLKGFHRVAEVISLLVKHAEDVILLAVAHLNDGKATIRQPAGMDVAADVRGQWEEAGEWPLDAGSLLPPTSVDGRRDGVSLRIQVAVVGDLSATAELKEDKFAEA